MPHFFINSSLIKNNVVEITDKELLNHLVNALRLNNGEVLKLFDENKMVYKTVVAEVSKKKVTANVVEKSMSGRFLDLNVSVAASILKPDAFTELISGITQLGIKEFYPLYTDNTAPSKAQVENKVQKWQKISDESVKQCERADFMKVFETKTLNDFNYSSFDKVIVFSEIEKTNTLKKVLKNVSSTEKILVIIGPEGGFSKKEFEFFEEKKFIQAKISNLILKAQTASISGISNIIYELGD